MRDWKTLLIAAGIFSLGIAAGCKTEANNGGTTGEATTGGSASGTTGDSGMASNRPEPKGDGNAVDGDTIKIGLVASRTGPLQPWGQDCINGAELAVEQANEAGGIDGKMIELIIQDSESLPEKGKNAAENLAAQGVVGLLGEVSSGITGQIADVAYETGVPNVAVGATKPSITEQSNNVFRVCYTDDFQGPVMAKFAYDDLGLRKVAVMTDIKQPYSQGLSESFKKNFVDMGGEIIIEENYESGATQFSGQLSNIKESSPDGIFLSGYFNEVGPIAKQARDLGIDKSVKLMGGDGWDSAEILSSGGDAIVGGYFCNHYNEREDRAQVTDFLSAFQAKFGTKPGTTMGALGYDATALMIDALKRADSLDSKALTAAIEDTEGFEGVSGTITLKGQSGDPLKRALVVELQPEGQVFAKDFSPEEVFGN